MYVEQEDQHLPELTVRETFDFAARCQGVGAQAGELSSQQVHALRAALMHLQVHHAVSAWCDGACGHQWSAELQYQLYCHTELQSACS